MLTLLTPTGCRPEAWALCQHWMNNQTYTGTVKWVIVDDGKYAQEVNFRRENWHLTVIRPQPYWDNNNTQARNFRAGLEYIGDDEKLFIIEDDDYYAPDYLSVMAEKLKTYDTVGQGWNCYYHVKTGAIRINDNDTHASLCATAFKGKKNLELFRRQCERAPKLLDIPMWKHGTNRHVFKDRLVIGMKGLLGRTGIAGGHNMTTESPFDLSQWIGRDAKHYQQFL
jgi:hypothetical protein